MSTSDLSTKNAKAGSLRVFQAGQGQFYVENSQGKICYKVTVNNGTKSCTCGDYTSNGQKDPQFVCKHILAVVNCNGGGLKAEWQNAEKPKLDERWIIEIEGREFVKYPGLLDLGHQKGILKIDVDPLQYPTKENGQFAICKAAVVSKRESCLPTLEMRTRITAALRSRNICSEWQAHGQSPGPSGALQTSV